ncbi:MULTISPECIES: purine-cytosine permease family protein [Rhodanobacter]|uniref:purine-cytosine permease family protein n=1 Tax=Rhodanobacter TaxID=75309 RepID=UPI0009DBF08D|nr:MULTISPECIES: cytosine permease [Rhodanobacter]TAN17494.1 MAG: thiamine permease [Rhodanobacter sp.]UJJ56443.1 cytosine permease [Rhodanobacter thiooxydans]
MTNSASDESAQGFAHSAVPEEATGPARTVFFIVAGSCCGLPVFILSSNVTAGLGFRRALTAFIVGSIISGVLGGLSAYAGARTRMSLPLLAQRTFGHWGAQVVKLAIALSLIGWFGVIVSVLGATMSTTVQRVFAVTVPPAAISIPLSALVTFVVLKGVTGLERLGQVIVPLTAILLAIAAVLTVGKLDANVSGSGSGALGFGAAVSAIVGSYIVGITIQPDYGRFVRRPLGAGLACLMALGVAYPLVLFMSAIPSTALGQPDLIAALTALGIGLPALGLLLTGAWIDSSACMYSGSLSLANLFPRWPLNRIVVGVGIFGAVLALLHVEDHFMPFLELLSIALPPVAAVQCSEAIRPTHPVQSTTDDPAFRWSAIAAWIVGTVFGLASAHAGISITGIATLDSIIGALAATIVLHGFATFAASSRVAADAGKP